MLATFCVFMNLFFELVAYDQLDPLPINLLGNSND